MLSWREELEDPPTVMSFAINQDLPRTDDYVIGYVDLTRKDANDSWTLNLANKTVLVYKPSPDTYAKLVYNPADEDGNILRQAIGNSTSFTKQIGPSLILHFLCVVHVPQVDFWAGQIKCFKIYLTRIEVIGKINLNIVTQRKPEVQPSTS